MPKRRMFGEKHVAQRPWTGTAAFMLTLATMAGGAGREKATEVEVVAAPSGETEPVPHDGDAADDPAIWVHPTDSSKSRIIGTDKRGGLHVYDLDGKDLQTAGAELWPDNVDLLYGYPLNGRPTDLAVASTRAPGRAGVKIWSIDAATGRLSDCTAGGGVIPAFSGGVPYGVCTYHDPKSGGFYYFVNDKSGKVEQFHLETGDGNAGVTARRVRTFKLDSTVEGCVADDEAGTVYIAEEAVGVWKFSAAPDGGDKGKLIARVGDHGLAADVEGLTLYLAPEGKGYLIASSQGNSTFKVYDREGDNRFLWTIRTRDRPKSDSRPAIDAVTATDGIAVTSRSLGPTYQHGLFVAQDDANRKGNQNFKLFRWEDVGSGKEKGEK